MTEEQKIIIKSCRDSGLGYGTIAKNLGLKKETVAAFCRRNGLAGNRTARVENVAEDLQPMAILDRNTVPTPTALKTDSSEVTKMPEEWFQAEKLYYISCSITKSMLEKGMINEEVCSIIKAKLLETYRPISAMLLAGRSL